MIRWMRRDKIFARGGPIPSGRIQSAVGGAGGVGATDGGAFGGGVIDAVVGGGADGIAQSGFCAVLVFLCIRDGGVDCFL